MASTVTELLRRRFGGKSLPYDAEIEYLGTRGTQYIITDIVQTSANYEAEIKLRWQGSTVSNFECFFAYMTQASSLVPRSSLSKFNSRWMYGTNATLSIQVTPNNQIHTFALNGTTDGNKELLYIDGTQIGSSSIANTNLLPSNTQPYNIGNRNRRTTVDNPASADYYYVKYKLFSDAAHSTLIKEWDLIPVRIGTTAYMYDKVSGQLFGNAGTGDFILGDDI